MMEKEGWKYYEGKKVYIVLKNKRVYSGTVLSIESSPSTNNFWIVLVDKYGYRISFVNSEIQLIQEEGKREEEEREGEEEM